MLANKISEGGNSPSLRHPHRKVLAVRALESDRAASAWARPGQSKLSDQAMQNPQALAALQDKMDSVSHSPSIMESLPKSVRRRVNALRNLQVNSTHIEAKFYKEVHELERKYAALYQPLFSKKSHVVYCQNLFCVLKRRDIVSGKVEPTEEECEWQSDHEDEEALAEDLKTKAAIEEISEEANVENPSGVPEFWLTIFRSVDMLSDMLQSFTLEFHFEPNEYFTNTLLTKVYKMKSEPDTDEPFSFEGPEIIDCEGCEIDWHKGKDVTVKTIKKKQKHKGRGTARVITKQVPNDSFFNFFNPIKVSPDKELDEDAEYTLATDFEIGHFFRERIVPRAVLYFTGEALEDDDSFEEEELEEGEEEEKDDEDDEEVGDSNAKSGDPKPECKQQ
ncbi:Nucleosome assembly protein 1-like 4 [Triplophysa tibetana]|uniref:Nucleosome assembly protein 1-like 4 n=1 Tax=Triplophysa tibetana TaxID=1572043 RepID=A0A5A9PNA7_9TELE|nr:Nucleosome assembly protein 1-like 4 [Triplophysa tibetana]